MRTLRDLGELGLIERLARIVPTAPAVVEGIGDDCAVVRVYDRLLLISCDMFMEDVHFRLSYVTPHDIGCKAAAAALSDIAAMGGAPLFCMVSLACPPDTEIVMVEELYRGMSATLSRFGSVIVGGDTIRSQGGIVLDVTVIGEAVGGDFMRRKGAQPGDLLAVTGHLGLAAAALHALEHRLAIADDVSERYTHPTPRIPEGQWLNSRPTTHAMLDISDGLVHDAARLAEVGQLGVDINPSAIPVLPQLDEYCRTRGADPLRFCLEGGEDYELAVALAEQGCEDTLCAFRHEFRTPITVVGRFTDEWLGVRLDRQETAWRGFDHFA